eukprot:761232-Hanusia_phi.AAC.1
MNRKGYGRWFTEWGGRIQGRGGGLWGIGPRGSHEGVGGGHKLSTPTVHGQVAGMGVGGNVTLTLGGGVGSVT